MGFMKLGEGYRRMQQRETALQACFQVTKELCLVAASDRAGQGISFPTPLMEVESWPTLKVGGSLQGSSDGAAGLATFVAMRGRVGDTLLL